jgi:hypothetical protein
MQGINDLGFRNVIHTTGKEKVDAALFHRVADVDEDEQELFFFLKKTPPLLIESSQKLI